ncbi:MAG: PQQ-binding-like beta-propeller repeat protein, partial [Planctomycetes bacterium]|nr:PQQ-binding-like beta-propeller repeat protein [Planctomycetota bacterium]
VFDKERIYGYGYRPEFYRGATRREYHLFASDRKALKPQPPVDYRRANRDYPHRGPQKFRVQFAWSRKVPLLGRAMVLTKNKLFVAGPPERALEDPSTFVGSEDVRLMVVRTKDGKKIKEYELTAPPVFDGMAVADGRVYLSTEDGGVHCFAAADQAGVQPLKEVVPPEERLPALKLAPEPGLVGYWKLDEGEGHLARDSSGRGLDGEVSGRWVTDEAGTHLATDGRPSALRIPDAESLHFGAGDFTVALWVKAERHDCRLLGKERFPENWWVINVLPDGQSELVLGQGRGRGRSVRAASTTPLKLNVWHHLAYVVDRKQHVIRCYLDGKLDSTVPIPASFTASLDVRGRDLCVPSRHKPFCGGFDELRLYQRALDGVRIREIFLRGRGQASTAQNGKHKGTGN